MGVAFYGRATATWKEAGGELESVSSHIVTLWLNLARVGQRRPGTLGNQATSFLQ